MEKVWADKKILIVEGKLTRFGLNNDLLKGAKSVDRILCPAENAFNQYTKPLWTFSP